MNLLNEKLGETTGLKGDQNGKKKMRKLWSQPKLSLKSYEKSVYMNAKETKRKRLC